MNKFHLHAFADEAGQDLNDQIAALRDNGYEGMEIRKVEGINVSKLTVEQAKEIDKRMEKKELEIETDGKNEQHYGVMNAFAGAILRGEPLIANGEEGINGLMLSNAMHLSAWTESKVTLPIDEDVYYEELMKRVKTSKRKTNTVEAVADTSGSY